MKANGKGWPKSLISFSLKLFFLGSIFICLNFSSQDQSLILNGEKLKLKEIRFDLSLGIVLLLKARSFQPGEIVLAQLESKENIGRSWINFKDQKFYFYREKSAQGFFFLALIGLDGELQAGPYDFQLIVEKQDKTWEIFNFSLNLGSRDFRHRKLTVDQLYLNPPPKIKERIEREAEIMRVIFSIITPDWLGDGPFIWPCSGRITALFGDQRLYNKQKLAFHQGLDIGAKLNQPVWASNSGRVVIASNFYLSGQLVVIDHGLGLFTTYHHLQKIFVKRGQMVAKGEIIGLVGSTGLSTGPHLHWSVRLNHNRIDPLSLLTLPLPEKGLSQN